MRVGPELNASPRPDAQSQLDIAAPPGEDAHTTDGAVPMLRSGAPPPSRRGSAIRIVSPGASNAEPGRTPKTNANVLTDEQRIHDLLRKLADREKEIEQLRLKEETDNVDVENMINTGDLDQNTKDWLRHNFIEARGEAVETPDPDSTHPDSTQRIVQRSSETTLVTELVPRTARGAGIDEWEFNV